MMARARIPRLFAVPLDARIPRGMVVSYGTVDCGRSKSELSIRHHQDEEEVWRLPSRIGRLSTMW